MPMDSGTTHNESCPDLGQCRESFLTALRYPDQAPAGSDVVGVTVLQYESVSVLVDLPDGTSLTFNSEELRRALDPLDAVSEVRAA